MWYNTHMRDMRDIYWLAGLLEGEGCFSQHRHASPRLFVGMTDEDTILRAQKIMGCGTISKPKRRRSHHKQMWVLTVTAESVQWMMTLYSLMSERRQARIRECLKTWLEVKSTDVSLRRERQELFSTGKSRCSKCREILHLDQFYRDNRTSRPRGPCKSCYHLPSL